VNAGVQRESIKGTEVVVKRVKSTRRKDKVVKEEKQITIFLPNVSISNLDSVKELSCWDSTCMHLWHLRVECKGAYSEDVSVVPMWTQVTKKNGKSVCIRGRGNDGELYLATVYSEDLYHRLEQEEEEVKRQWYSKKYEEAKPQLEYLEKVGRYEEAAEIYEELDMLDKARETRLKGRTVVSVNLNRLLQQLGERGFTVTYHCSNCGAPLRIDAETKVEAVKSCSHCGSRIEAINLANFIKSSLS